MKPTRYRGRFAPSPTGPLHFGSLVAAVGSYLQARSRGGDWLVRIEDLDPPREASGAADEILRTLDGMGLRWDEDVVYQSRRQHAYLAALDVLTRRHAIYPCACSRREIADSSLDGVDGPIYPGTCREGLPAGRAARTWRVRTAGARIEFPDACQGTRRHNLDTEFGDYVVRRADDLFAYQLAVVVDDAAQGITEVVRGADLLASTPRQIHLQRLLGLSTPSYAHLPVATNSHGEKLSKQTEAEPVSVTQPLPLLHRALRFLGQPTPDERGARDLEGFWRWAVDHWRLECVPREPRLTLKL